MSTLTYNKTEAVRLKLDIPEETRAYLSRVYNFMRDGMTIMDDLFRGGRISKYGGYNFYFNDFTPSLYGTDDQIEKGRLSDGEMRKMPEFSKIIREHWGEDHQQTHISGAITKMGEMEKAYIKRNTDDKTKEINWPNQAIQIREKSIQNKSKIFSFDKNGEAYIAAFDNKKQRLKYRLGVVEDYYGNFNLLPTGKRGIAESTGGILSTKKNELILTKKRVLEIPKADLWLGTDFNKSHLNWLVFSRETKYGKIISKLMFSELKRVEDEMRLLQKEASDFEKYSSKERRGLRKKQDKAHEQQARIIRELVDEILQDFYDKNGAFGLGIDSVHTGQKHGSFGQDKLQKEMAFWMTRKGLPFYHVATPYTSRRCPECGTVCTYGTVEKNDDAHLKARGEDNFYRCHNKECKVSTEEGKMHGDLLGAINNEVFSRWLQDDNFEMTNTTNNQYDISQWSFIKNKGIAGKCFPAKF